MKKLLLMAFAILTVSAFAAEENANTVTQVENTNIAAVQIQGADISLGESFMAAFGMSESGTTQGGNSSGNEGGSTSGSTTAQGSVAVAVGVASAAANTAAVNAANSTTIVTPYGKY